jgi:hypothetical protein
MAIKGILLDADDDLKVENGTLKTGERKMQDAWMVLSANQGDFKEDPLAGVNLVRMIRGGENNELIRKTVEIGLERAGVKYDDIKKQMEILINNKSI